MEALLYYVLRCEPFEAPFRLHLGFWRWWWRRFYFMFWGAKSLRRLFDCTSLYLVLRRWGGGRGEALLFYVLRRSGGGGGEVEAFEAPFRNFASLLWLEALWWWWSLRRLFGIFLLYMTWGAVVVVEALLSYVLRCEQFEAPFRLHLVLLLVGIDMYGNTQHGYNM